MLQYFIILSGISKVISRSAVEGAQIMDFKLLKRSRTCFATCLFMLPLDIPQKFTEYSIMNDASYAIVLLLLCTRLLRTIVSPKYF